MARIWPVPAAILLVALSLAVPAAASNATLRGGGRCESHLTPKDSKCTGCPPMINGKLCASTTRYNNRVMGACGCAETGGGAAATDLPLTWWSLSQKTAALNCKSLDPAQPHLSWCPSNCEQCYELCSTGGTTQGRPTSGGKCEVFKIVDRCGDGYGSYPEWCSNKLSWQECQADPGRCRQEGSTNKFGYSAHFDLQDVDHQISAGMGWDNVEVTFEPVSCSRWQGPQPAVCSACAHQR